MDTKLKKLKIIKQIKMARYVEWAHTGSLPPGFLFAVNAQ